MIEAHLDIYRQSAVVPYRSVGGQLEILLITSRKGNRWVIPKGIVEPGLSPAASAAKEAREEAGVEGRVSPVSLGAYRYVKWGGICRVEVFALCVTRELETWEEDHIRRRLWQTPDKAAKLVREPDLRHILREMPKGLREACQGGKMQKSTGPARKILLFRHAKSAWDNPNLTDFERPLAPRGERACGTMTRFIREQGLQPQIILCSAAVRTRQTLDRIKAAFDTRFEVEYEKALYLCSPSIFVRRLRELPDSYQSVMVIGHNPGLQSLALDLIGAGDPALLGKISAKFPTAGLAMLHFEGPSWKELKAGSCELQDFVVPRELA